MVNMTVFREQSSRSNLLSEIGAFFAYVFLILGYSSNERWKLGENEFTISFLFLKKNSNSFYIIKGLHNRKPSSSCIFGSLHPSEDSLKLFPEKSVCLRTVHFSKGASFCNLCIFPKIICWLSPGSHLITYLCKEFLKTLHHLP